MVVDTRDLAKGSSLGRASEPARAEVSQASSEGNERGGSGGEAAAATALPAPDSAPAAAALVVK